MRDRLNKTNNGCFFIRGSSDRGRFAEHYDVGTHRTIACSFAFGGSGKGGFVERNTAADANVTFYGAIPPCLKPSRGNGACRLCAVCPWVPACNGSFFEPGVMDDAENTDRPTGTVEDITELHQRSVIPPVANPEHTEQRRCVPGFDPVTY